MENILRKTTILTILFLLPAMAFAQKAYYFGPDAFVNVNDSVVIRLNDYEGAIQWQKSLDLEVWENISGATHDTLLFLADTTKYFRAQVIAGFCDPFYSDTAKVGVFRIITISVTDITDSSAISGGNVIADGGAPITARGVVWSNLPNPTIDNNEGHTNDGSGLGEFTSTLTSLLPDTTYYLRAYATNTFTTGYGQQESFTTEATIGDGDWPTDTVTEVVEVLNPITGKIWMDRNLGASRAAISSTDTEAHGDLYQWGRAADGHQLRTSDTTSTLSNSDTPGHGDFITVNNSPYDWRSPQNDDLWQGVNGINNPCPVGYRIPTEAELNAERLSWSSNNAAGAFASPLKLPVAGARYSSDGSLNFVGSYGFYWSSAVDGTYSRFLSFSSSPADMFSYFRAFGFSVRCIKDSDADYYSLTIDVFPEGTGEVTGAGAYAEGTIVNITAIPNENYMFANWTGDTEYIADPSAINTTVTMPAQDINLTANFETSGDNGDWPTDTVTQVVEVLNPATGKTWMDRNLGASRAATSSTDTEAYGHLYQWGRAADGHQKRTSGTTSTLSNSDTPGHGDFITVNNSPYDWRSPQNDNLWQGINGTNNPCPTGYRLPTEAELNAERLSWSSNNAAGAFASPLKLPVAGRRIFIDGSLVFVGSNGDYWSSTVSGSSSRSLVFGSGGAGMYSLSRALGFSVRCLKE